VVLDADLVVLGVDLAALDVDLVALDPDLAVGLPYCRTVDVRGSGGV
jgi:hypothetical protein